MVRVRGANAAWDDVTARPPVPPRIYEFRHLLTDEELCNPANDMPIPVTNIANYTVTHNCSSCEHAERELERAKAAGRGWEEGEEGQEDLEFGASRKMQGSMKGRAGGDVHVPQRFLGAWACPHR